MENELLTIDEYDITEDGDTQEVEVPADEVDAEISAEITEYDMEVEPEETVVVDISESMGWVSGDIRYHDSLLGIDEPNQHPITSISHLREELDEIERLKTVYSDKINVANYYKWNDASYDEYGYFVSLVPNTSTIKICDGADIFGVVTNDAAFVGGQNEDAPRGNSYGLVVTSGIVEVRCELDVEVGDCVVSSARGCAQKSDTNYGYKVLAKTAKSGIECAVIMLGVQADVTDALGHTLNEIGDRVTVNEKNIVSAINVANQAYNKAGESATISEEALKNALDAVLKSDVAVGEVEDIKNAVTSTSTVAAQAKAIAESAATSAASMRQEAVDAANGAWSSVNELKRTLDPIATWSENGVSGADYLVTKMNDGIATTYDIKTVEDNIEVAQNAIIRNGKELYSLMTTIDKYSVGEYSQADGLTIEQAKSILEVGMIYVPTTLHPETYSYTDADGKPQEFTRSFTPGYLYQWGVLDSGLYGWITVDKNFDQTTEENTSSMAVYFSQVEITIGGDNNYGYWYTDGDEVIDVDGNSGTYQSYTLYKWNDDGWLAVATLAGNVSNRATSQVRQTANEIAAEITNARGSVAGFGAWIEDTESRVQSTASWTKGDSADGEKLYNLATIVQTADDGGSSLALVVADMDGNKVLEGASIVLGQGEEKSYIQIAAEDINLDGYVTFENLSEADGKTVINGANIETGTLSASQITTGTLDADKVTVTNLDASQIKTGAIQSKNYNSGNGSDPIPATNPNYGAKFSLIGTYINLDDGKIYTPSFVVDGDNSYMKGLYLGNLDAKQITSGYIDAERIEAESITADKIEAGAITTDKLDTNAIKSANYVSCDVSKNDFELTYKDANTQWLSRTDGKLFAGVIVILRVFRDGANGYESVITSEFICTSLEKDTIRGQERYYCPIDISEYISKVAASWQGTSIESIYSFSDTGTSLVLDKGVLVTKAMLAGANRFCFKGSSLKSDLYNDDLWGGYGPESGSEYVGDFYVDTLVSDSSISITARRTRTDSTELGLVKGSASWDDVVLAGNLASNSTSDIRVKNNIEVFSDAYDILFDKLAPKRYKYVNGTSGRYHTGFIAQEVVKAVEDAGLTTQDFAAVCLDFNDESVGLWRLRRDEFVALNTWQIQKLKSRVAELEEKIENMEKKLKGENENGTETTNS